MLLHASLVKKALASYASPEKAQVSMRFFKTGPGQYGAGDTFIGVTVPEQREVAKKFAQLPRAEAELLLQSSIHEHRLTALIILSNQYTHLVREGQGEAANHIVRTYLANLDRVQNWDLVDLSAPHILGAFCVRAEDASTLYALAASPVLWRRRVAIVATYAYIRQGVCTHTFAIAELLLSDSEDLIHKATGWMLRECGKKDKVQLAAFLTVHAHHMPRTMLRYAIERLPAEERRRWMAQGRAPRTRARR
jgi:3-methyladenine DNA glycosylase AlkD